MSTPRRGSLASYVLHGAALLLAVTACTPRAGRAPAAGAAPAPGAPTPGDAVTLRILHFNDVYEIGPVEGGRSGGLARVATLRAAMRDTVPSLVTTLGGDYLSPSALGTARVGAERLNGRQMVATLNALGLDVAVLGNHEFDVPEAAFRAHLDRARYTVLGALLRHVLDQGRSNAGTGGYLQTSAVLRADGAWEIGGQPLRDDAWYPVALTDFLLTGNETGLDFLTRDNPELKVERELRDVRQALIDEMRARWK